MTDSWKKNSWSKDTDILKLCRCTEAYMQQWYLQQCNSLLLHPTSLSYTGHSALVFLILLKIKVRSCYSCAHNPSMASSLLLIQAKILMVHKVSRICLCDFYDFISYFFLISEHPRFLAVSHCDSDTHASGSEGTSEIFFLGLTWDTVVKSLPPSFHTGL